MRRIFTIAVVVGCAPIEAYELGVCGNNVVEADNGEDCDLIADSALGEGLQCGPADGTPQACRYICDGAECPRGWGCDEDGICRAASGSFDVDDDPVAILRAQQIALADIAGSEELEVVVRLDGDVFVLGEDEGRYRPSAEISIANSRGALAFADVDGDELDDLLVPGASHAFDPNATPQLHVLRHDGERLTTAIVPQLPTGDPILGAAAISGAGAPPRDVLTVHATPAGRLEARVAPEGCANMPAAASVVVDGPIATVPPPPWAQNEDGSGRVIVAAIGGRIVTELRAERLCGPSVCTPAAEAPPCVTELSVAQTIQLTAPLVAPGCVLFDRDGDDDLDLACHIEGDALAVATGDGEVLTPDSPSILAALSDLPSTQPRACAPIRRILAAADLDRDGRTDLVTAHGIFINDGESYRRIFARTQGDGWGEAVVADFDRDRGSEIAVTVLREDADCSATRLQLVVETAGAFGEVLVREISVPQRMRGGDFDGDGIDDVAVVESAPGSVRASVFFGDTKEALEDKASVGGFADVSELVAVQSRGAAELNDELLSDLVVVSEAGRFQTSVTGTTRRSLLSPAEFDADGLGATQGVALAGRLLPRTDDTPSKPDVLTIAGASSWLLRDEDVHHADAPFALPQGALAIRTACSMWAVGTPAPDGGTLFAGADGAAPAVAGIESECDIDGPAPVLAAARFDGPRDAPVLHVQVAPIPGFARRPTWVGVFDFDGSGMDDLVVRLSDRGLGVLFWVRDPDPLGTALQPTPILVGRDVLAAAPLNADRDDRLELAVVVPEGLLIVDHQVGRSPDLIVSEPVFDLPAVPSSTVQLAAGDLDGDELHDLALLLGDALYIYPAQARE